jgi:glycosidase
MWLVLAERRVRAARAVLAVAMMARAVPQIASAEEVSAPAILQLFEARWDTIEDRMADIFQVGYGQLWLPPPTRADSGNQSVGYDVFDRFDLGGPRNETLYGTETSLKSNIAAAHRAGVRIHTDLILNHNGFSDLGTVDTKGTPSTADDVTFAQSGGYPGFVVTLPDDVDGDFHGAFEGGDHQGRLAGLIDVAQEKNYQYIRQPVAAGNPNNIPPGTASIFGRTPANLPNPNNARFYPDQAAGGLTLTDPELGTTVTRYDFNQAAPLSGDPVLENTTGLLMRNAQWMVQAIGVDGFRVDAAKHFPEWVLDYVDQAVFRANPRLQHDGSIQPVFMFSEVLDGNQGLLQSYIRRDLPNPTAISPTNTTVAGNRDALDFPLFYAMRDNLSGNGLANNWHHIRNASQDTHDDGQNNGSQGVAFVDSHDNLGGGFPHLKNVAYAYTLMRPGNAIVYFNAKEFGEGRDFPNDGKDDALGGLYGESIARLVELRNTHGRGNFHERWIDDAFNPNGFSNIYVYERENSAIVGLNSRLDSGFDQRTPIQTGFAPGAVLVELTGNADDPTVDPSKSIPSTVRVNGNGQVTLRVPRNAAHGRGYVVYGVPGPEGTLTLSGVASTLPGATPTAATNGTARLAAVDVIRTNSFGVRLDTTPVSLADPDNPGQFVRDFDADGEAAFLRVDAGMDLNSVSGVDVTNPADVAYGFEQFTDTNLPGYSNGGVGHYEQQIDATHLSEGRHNITVRAFRHRASGPAVYTDFKRTVYVDRLPPEAAVVSFDPYASAPGNPNNRDLIVRSTDQTADNMHIFLDLPAALTDQQVLAMALGGQNDAGQYDRDQWIYGFNGVSTGNHVTTVVTFEPTFDGVHGFNVQRFAGLMTETNIGAGFGDLDNNGAFTTSDFLGTGNNSAEDVLYSQNAKFRAAFDINGDGLGDNRDLFGLGDELVVAGAGQAVLDAYDSLLRKRGDFDSSGTTNLADFESLFDKIGAPTWLYDLNVDGVVDADDAAAFVIELNRTLPGDYNVDGSVDAADYTVWRDRLGGSGAALVADGNFDSNVDDLDYEVWRTAFGFQRVSLQSPPASASNVPEPSTAVSITVVLAALASRLTLQSRKRPRS